jgi:two-component system chemotaxis sensor kinase CheA
MKKYEGDPDILALFKNTARAQLTKVNNALLAVEKGGVNADALKLMRGEIHTLKGDSRMIGLESISASAHAVEDLLAALEKAGRGEGAGVLARIFAVLDAIDRAIERLPEEIVEIDATREAPAREARPDKGGGGKGPRQKTEAAGEPAAGTAGGPEGKEDDAELISLNVRRIEELVQKSSAFPQYFNKFNFLLARLENLRADMEADPRPFENAKQLGSILYQFSHELSFFDLVSRQFQNEITKLKLVPLSAIFDQFPRLVRDAAQRTGKSVSLTVRGRDAELDKTVVAKLKNVLIHLLRNAVDHGVEQPSAREKAGKPREGRIVLSAQNRGDRVEVEIGDDGAGLDLELIKAKAVEKGLLPAEQAAGLDADAAAALIFAPGFSTKEVSELSGRGVGLDVVSRTLKELNGDVAVKSIPGRGATFTVSLPLISSFIPITVFLLGERLYGIPSSSIKSVVRVSALDARRIGAGRPVIAVDEVDVSLVDLESFFGFGGGSDGKNKNVIVVRNRDEISGFVVRDVVYEKKMIIRKADWLVRLCPVVMGAVLSGRERAIPILNVPELFGRLKETREGVAKARAKRGGADFRLKNVLLVEDSAVSRTRQREIIEAQDLNVFEAANGKEALALLDRRAFDVVITDIEMPVMNGPEFIRRVRERPELSGLPIVVMSSYSDNLDAIRALGVSTFVDKGTFTARRLLEALALENMI